MQGTYDLITEFLNLKRIAFVGVSRNPKDFSRSLFNDLRERGYDVVPVNPSASEIDSVMCFPQVHVVAPPAQGALVMTSRSATTGVLNECATAGISLVWIYGILGPREISPSVMTACDDLNLRVIAGYCPYMFLPHAGVIHNLHRFAAKMLRSYPN